MDLKRLIIGTRQQKLTIFRKINRSDRLSKATFDNLRMSLDCVVPDSNGGILRARGNHVSLRWYFHIMDWSFMTNESEWSHCGLEVPYHNCSVFRARDSLFQVWVECNSADFIFVTFERSFKCWVTLWGGFSSFFWHFKFKLFYCNSNWAQIIWI